MDVSIINPSDECHNRLQNRLSDDVTRRSHCCSQISDASWVIISVCLLWFRDAEWCTGGDEGFFQWRFSVYHWKTTALSTLYSINKVLNVHTDSLCRGSFVIVHHLNTITFKISVYSSLNICGKINR